MTRIARDAADGFKIPITPNLDMVWGYINGANYTWTSEMWDRFGSKIKRVRVDTTGGNPENSDMIDSEKGDATIDDDVRWVKWRLSHLRGVKNVVYTYRDNIQPLDVAMHFAGLQRAKDYHLSVATLDGTTRIDDMSGVVAVQAYGRGTYDESIIYDDAWFPSDPEPNPPAPMKLGVSPEMVIVRVRENEVPGGHEWPGTFVFNGTTLSHVSTWADEKAFEAVLPVVEITWRQWQEWSAKPVT